MRPLTKILLLVVLTLIVGTSQAQDPRFSQYAASPLTLNPAMTGVFNGNYRVTAIYRSQWNSILKDESVPMFRTFSASFDMRFPVGNNGDGFGVGMVFLTDKAAQSEFGTNQVNFAFSYQKSLNSKKNHFIGAGFQAGVAQRSINYNNLRFGNQFDASIGGFNGGIDNGELIGDESFLFYDVSAGLFWYFIQPNTRGRTNYYAGVAFHHLNRPNMSFYQGDDANLYMKISANAGAQFRVAQAVDILPSVMILSQGPAFETNLGAYAKILFEQTKSGSGDAVYVGAFYRIVGRDNVTDDGGISSEALILALRLDYQSFTLGFSYDLNFSELTDASNTRGGFEISAAHIGGWDKKNKVNFCPRF